MGIFNLKVTEESFQDENSELVQNIEDRFTFFRHHRDDISKLMLIKNLIKIIGEEIAKN
jgi:hypothetical protein